MKSFRQYILEKKKRRKRRKGSRSKMHRGFVYGWPVMGAGYGYGGYWADGSASGGGDSGGDGGGGGGGE